MKDILTPRALPQRRNLWQRARSLFMRWVLPKMKLNLIAVLIGCAGLAAGQTITDPAHIEVYILSTCSFTYENGLKKPSNLPNVVTGRPNTSTKVRGFQGHPQKRPKLTVESF